MTGRSSQSIFGLFDMVNLFKDYFYKEIYDQAKTEQGILSLELAWLAVIL